MRAVLINGENVLQEIVTNDPNAPQKTELVIKPGDLTLPLIGDHIAVVDEKLLLRPRINQRVNVVVFYALLGRGLLTLLALQHRKSFSLLTTLLRQLLGQPIGLIL